MPSLFRFVLANCESGGLSALRLRRVTSSIARLFVVSALVGALVSVAPCRAQVTLDTPESLEVITIAADSAQHWTQGVYEVWTLKGHCYLNQGQTYARSDEAVLWIERGALSGDPPHRVIAYLEGQVSIDFAPTFDEANKPTGKPKSHIVDKKWLGRFYSRSAPDMRIKTTTGEPTKKPPILARATAEWTGTPSSTPESAVKPAQFETPAEDGVSISPRDPFARPGQPATLGSPEGPEIVPPAGARRVRVFPRSNVPVQAQWFANPNVPGEWIAIISSGVNLIVDGLDGVGSIDIATDRIVIWTQGQQEPDLTGSSLQDQNVPFEIYLEGNIVFRQGDRVIFADRMFYDVRRQQGTVLNAEILSPVPNYQGLARLRAEVLQQVNRDQFIAENASLTSSRLGIPSYEFRAGQLVYQDTQQPAVDPQTGAPLVDPQTGEPIVAHNRRLTSRSNVLAIEQLPVFYWPTFTTNLEDPTFYFERVIFKQDSVFGTQLYTDLNMYELLGIENPPEGVDWDLSLDYLSERGPGLGTTFLWDRPDFFGLQGPAFGMLDAWGIHDDGFDNLGRDFRHLTVPDKLRGRVFGRHRQYFQDGYQLSAEVGYISDRNFLEQYFENEWDEFKDQTTGLEFKRYIDNSSWAISVDGRLNPFFTQTEQLPRFDHYLMGQSLLQDKLTWFAHSSAMYSKFQTANPPTDPVQASQWGPLPWEVPAEGERLATRHEIDVPFTIGGVKVVPYALGELAHWGEDISGDSLDRAYGQVGVRSSASFWNVTPEIEDDLLNLHGIAHKLVFDVDAGYTDATQDFEQLQLYDPIDDDDIEAFRRRFPFFDFGGPPPVPFRFDEREWAIRSGIASNVASPSTELAEDLFAIRMGLRQRWQTKRGPEANRRIIDWIMLDVGGTIFPDATRDNFGETLGLVNYNFIWHVGDRLSLVSDGYFDFYPDAPKYMTVGGFLNRPPRGSLYLGIRSMEGPISANVVAASYTYRMSPKWASTFGTTFNLSQGGNIGQNMTVTRIGESFLITLGVNVDASKGNVGANFAIEPRLLARYLGGGPNGVQIPPAGAYGLE